jgi:hypothetical protein
MVRTAACLPACLPACHACLVLPACAWHCPRVGLLPTLSSARLAIDACFAAAATVLRRERACWLSLSRCPCGDAWAVALACPCARSDSALLLRAASKPRASRCISDCWLRSSVCLLLSIVQPVPRCPWIDSCHSPAGQLLASGAAAASCSPQQQQGEALWISNN